MLEWSALLLGLAGSLHCIGMCGPLVLALPGRDSSRVCFLISRALYNAGRTLTYVLLGIVAGIAGQVISLAGYQQTLSLVLGICLLLAVLIPAGLLLRPLPQTARLSGWFRRLFGTLLRRHSLPALFGLGVLNGFLPCGLVYVALAGAAATGTVTHATGFMLFFGLGTIPAMLATAFGGKMLGLRAGVAVRRLVPAAMLVVAVLLILRGLSLGIPYLSPALPAAAAASDAAICH